VWGIVSYVKIGRSVPRMTIQEELRREGYNMVAYRGKRYDLSCFEDCKASEATFRLDPDGIIFWVANDARGSTWPGVYFRFKNGEVLDLIREARWLDRDIKKLSERLAEKESKLINLGYAKEIFVGIQEDPITLVSRDKEWLSKVDSVGAIYTEGPKGAAFLIGGEI
jgi:hypothetical protein